MEVSTAAAVGSKDIGSCRSKFKIWALAGVNIAAVSQKKKRLLRKRALLRQWEVEMNGK